MAVKIQCPACNTVYNLPKLPSKRVAATCKKCGGKIVIDPIAEAPEAHKPAKVHGKAIKDRPPLPKRPTTEKPEPRISMKFVKRFSQGTILVCVLVFIVASLIEPEIPKEEVRKKVLEFDLSMKVLGAHTYPALNKLDEVRKLADRQQATLLDVYRATVDAKNACKLAKQVCLSAKVPSGLPGEIKDLLKQAKEDLFHSYRRREDALSSLAKWFDEKKPKYLQEFTDQLAWSEDDYNSAFEKIEKAKLEVAR